MPRPFLLLVASGALALGWVRAPGFEAVEAVEALEALEAFQARLTQDATPATRATPQEPSQDPPTFARDVGPLVYRSCTVCHHDGGSGPFPLVTYEQVRRRARQIAIVTDTRFMPPWKPAPGFGTFHDERRLSDDEIALFARWAAAGAPLGDADDLPAPPTFESEWALGPPDLVLSMDEAYVVPPEGKDDYRSFVVPSGFQQERYVRAFDFRPDNPPPVHHIITLLDTAGMAPRLDAETPGVGYEGMVALGEMFGTEINGWGPGATPRFLPEGTAWKLPPGVNLVIDTHFQTTGRPEPVKISIGLYLTDRKPRRPMTNLSIAAPVMSVPPGMAEYVVDFSFELPTPFVAVSIQPHAHYIGKDLGVVAHRPDGQLVPLIRIPDWDFSWQDSYRFAEPIVLPAGTVLQMRYVYDNSSANERNPYHPPRRILSGPRSSDEMALLWVQGMIEEDDLPALRDATLRHERAIERDSLVLQEIFAGLVYGFDADGDGMLDQEEDARATAYVNALPEHQHAAVFDRDGDGRLDDDERALLERAIARWNGER